MCLAIPGKIVETVLEQPDLAVVDVCGVRRRVNIGLLENEDIRAGDWVLIHVGFAMSKIGDAQAQDQIQLLMALGESQAAMQEAEGYEFGEGEPSQKT
jgi:hydrogenase expression/formation protein HypC